MSVAYKNKRFLLLKTTEKEGKNKNLAAKFGILSRLFCILKPPRQNIYCQLKLSFGFGQTLSTKAHY